MAGAALLGARVLAALLAGTLGAALLVTGLLALAAALPTEALARHPLVAAGLLAVLAIAGASAQLDHAWGGGGARRAGASRAAEAE